MDTAKISKVANVAKFNEQKSALVLKEYQLEHSQKCTQLDQLIHFKQEYESRLGSIGYEGIAARQLQDYHLFLEKLNLAVEQKLDEVQLSETSLGVLRAQWQEKSQRTSALDKLLEQQLVDQRYHRDKAEQHEADEDTLARRVMDQTP